MRVRSSSSWKSFITRCKISDERFPGNDLSRRFKGIGNHLTATCNSIIFRQFHHQIRLEHGLEYYRALYQLTFVDVAHPIK